MNWKNEKTHTTPKLNYRWNAGNYNKKKDPELLQSCIKHVFSEPASITPPMFCFSSIELDFLWTSKSFFVENISFSALSKQWAGFILSFWAGFICSSSCQIEDSSKWGQNKTSGSSLAQIFIRVSEMFPETTLQPWQVLGSNRGLTTGQLWAVEGRQR